MRNGQNKRMRGRNRNKGHHGGGGGGHHSHHHQNPLTRVYESNGPEVKIRGNAQHVAEKYLQLARDATTSGDPVTAENHYQHAEHYLRLIAAAQEQFRQQNPYYQPQTPQADGNRDGSFDDGDDDGQPMQGQPMLPQPNFGQPNMPNPQQQSYQQREQPQQYQPQPQQYQPQPQHQPRPQYNHQPQQPPPYQPPQHQQPQHQQPPQMQPAHTEASDGERLPSFITGTQPNPQNFGQNGYDNQDRFPRHRRRRHRTGGPRPEVAGGAPQDFRGDDGPDDSRPV